jgi:hypothetical protein
MACIDEVRITVTVTSLNAFFVFIAVPTVVPRALEYLVCVCVCVCDERNNKFASCLSLYPLRCLFLENLHTQSSYPVRTVGARGRSGGIATRYSQSLHWVGVSGQRHDPAALPSPPPQGINSVAFEVVAEGVPEPVWTCLGMRNSPPTGFRTPFCASLNLI